MGRGSVWVKWIWQESLVGWLVGWLWMFSNMYKINILQMQRSTVVEEIWLTSSPYLVPAVTIVLPPILSARSARSLMYSSPVRTGEYRIVFSSNEFPSPPSSITYSMPKRLCRLLTLSKNQLVASGFVMFNLTQYFPLHWVNNGTYWGTKTMRETDNR